MSLNHHFLLVRRDEHNYGDYNALHLQPDAIALHADFIGYIDDMLSWVPTINLCKKCFVATPEYERRTGLNSYGPTAITSEGATMARRIFSLWAAMFACGPETLDLHSWYQFDTDDDGETLIDSGRYSRLILDRDETVAALHQLADWCEQVASSDGALYIFHCGV